MITAIPINGNGIDPARESARRGGGKSNPRHAVEQKGICLSDGRGNGFVLAIRNGYDENETPFPPEYLVNDFPDDQERVWIEVEHESIRKQAVFDLPTKTFTPEGERAYHANEIEAWSPIED